MPEDLELILQNAAVTGTVLVQAEQTVAETEWMLSLAKSNDWIKGVVGWMDLQAADVTEQALVFKQYQKLKGFRHIVQAEPDARFMLRPQFVRGIRAIGKLDFSYDILIYPYLLDAAADLVAQCPDQRFVLDHLAKPYIKSGEIAAWKKDIQRLSTHENVFAKLSGLITEANWGRWTEAGLKPYLDVALECFGPERLMWGSDWPVCLVAGNYNEVLHLVQHYIQALSPAEQAQIMGGTATAFYHLK